MLGVGEQGGAILLHQRREAEKRGGASHTCATMMPMATSNWRRGRGEGGVECVLLNFSSIHKRGRANQFVNLCNVVVDSIIIKCGCSSERNLLTAKALHRHKMFLIISRLLN